MNIDMYRAANDLHDRESIESGKFLDLAQLSSTNTDDDGREASVVEPEVANSSCHEDETIQDLKLLPFADDLQKCLAAAKRVSSQFSTKNIDVPLLFYAAALTPEGQEALLNLGVVDPKRLVREMAGELAIEGQGQCEHSCKSVLSADMSAVLVSAMATAMQCNQSELHLASCLGEAIAIVRNRKASVLAGMIAKSFPLQIMDSDAGSLSEGTLDPFVTVNETLADIKEGVGGLEAQLLVNLKMQNNEMKLLRNRFLIAMGIIVPAAVLIGMGIGHFITAA